MFSKNGIKLAPFEEKHLEATLYWINDIDIAQRINRVLPVTMMEHLEWFRKITLDQSQLIFAIEETKSKRHLGNCGLKNIDSRSHKAELWIYLGKDHSGKGAGVIATRNLIEYGFSYLNLNRIYLYTLAGNEPAIKTFTRSGMVEEGLFREDVFIANQYRDTVRMAILRREYQEEG